MSGWSGYDMKSAQNGADPESEHISSRAPDQLLSYAEADIGVVYVVGRGFWNDEIIDRHFRELRQTAVLARRHAGSVRVLVDLRSAAVQSPMVAARIKNETRLIWTENDRIAVVLQSALATMQIKRVVDGGNHASFTAIEDARRWLGLRPRARLNANDARLPSAIK